MPNRLTNRILLLGWDAADWQIISPLMEAGQMPVLKRLVEHGVSGKVSSLQPMLSPILWNSIATGKRADKHGILGFLEPTPDGTAVRAVSSTSRRAKAVWNILSQSGLRSHVVNWFASHPAEPINGTVVSNRLTDDTLAAGGPGAGDLVPLPPEAVHPPEFLAAAEDLRVHPAEITPQQLLAFFDPDHLPDPQDPRFSMFARHLAQCSSTHNVATHLAARDDWDLLAVYYDTIDRIGHEFVEYHPPAMAHVDAADALVYGRVVTGVYRFHDMMLGVLLDLIGPGSTVLLVSDHGFYSDHLRPAVLEHARDPRKKFGPEQNPLAWHRPHGVFVAAGRPVRRDELLHGASLLDIAPTVLMLLGLAVPDDMDGRPLTRILAVPTDPPRVASYEPPHAHDGVHRDVAPEEADPFAAREAVRQLVALGYVEADPDGDAAALVASTDRDRRQTLAQTLFSAGRPGQAIDLLKSLLAEQDTPDMRCRLALCLASVGRLGEVEAMLSPVPPEAMAASPVLRLLTGQVRLAQGRLEEAEAILEPLGAEQFPLSYLHTALGTVYARRGRLAEAEAAFRTALDRDEDNAEAHDGLGTVLRRTGRHADAVYAHMRSAALQHARPTTHFNLGLALANTGQFDWAIRAFEVAVELAPDYRVAHRHLAQLYRRFRGDEGKAREHAQSAAGLRVPPPRASPAEATPALDSE